MVLASHAIVGAALGRASANPLASFALGFASHFALDAMPHWQYSLRSRIERPGDIMSENMLIGKGFIRDIFFIGIDFALGIAGAVVAFQGFQGISDPSLPVLFGALGGVCPDALQFAFWKMKKEPLIALQKFHERIHSKHDFPHDSKLGFFLQIGFVGLCIVLSRSFIR